MIRKHKIFFSILFVLIFCCVAVSGAGSWRQDRVVTIRFPYNVSEKTAKGKMALYLQQLVEEQMGGRFVVEVYPDTTLCDDSQFFEKLLLGEVQLGAVSMAKFTSYTKKLQIFDLPFLFKDMNGVSKFEKSSEGRELLYSMEDRGIVGLGYLNSGMKQMSATKNLADFHNAAGLTFRIMDADILQAQFEAVGAISSRRIFTETYGLLAQGIVDGQENTWANIYTKNFYKVQPYIVESNHGVLAAMIVTSKKFLQSLDPQDAAIFLQLIDQAAEYGNKLATQEDREFRQKIIDSGETNVVLLTDSERMAWEVKMKPVWAKFRDQVGENNLKKAIEIGKSS